MSEDQKNRIREALRYLLDALNDYSGPVEIDLRLIDITKMADPGRRYSYNADLSFVTRETL